MLVPMRLLSWNMRRASAASGAWEYLKTLNPDIALLQEVAGIPLEIRDTFDVAMSKPISKSGVPQKFSSTILSRYALGDAPQFSCDIEWIRKELQAFSGNLLSRSVTIDGCAINLVNVYSPAWPIARERWAHADVTNVKLSCNPDIWCTELLWMALNHTAGVLTQPLIVGGDFNSSETFDYLWPGGPSGNREFMDRMSALGLTEALRGKAGKLVPTFRNPRGGKIIHQLDHLYLSQSLWETCSSSNIGDPAIVFEKSFSDHLPIIADIVP